MHWVESVHVIQAEMRSIYRAVRIRARTMEPVSTVGKAYIHAIAQRPGITVFIVRAECHCTRAWAGNSVAQIATATQSAHHSGLVASSGPPSRLSTTAHLVAALAAADFYDCTFF